MLSIISSEYRNCFRLSSFIIVHKIYEEQFKILGENAQIGNTTQEIIFTKQKSTCSCTHIRFSVLKWIMVFILILKRNCN